MRLSKLHVCFSLCLCFFFQATQLVAVGVGEASVLADFKKVKAERDRLSTENKRLTAENNELEREAGELKKKIANLEARVAAPTGAVAVAPIVVSGDSPELQQALDKLRAENAALKNEHKSAVREIQKTIRTLDQEKQDAKETKNQLGTIATELLALKRDYAQLLGELEQARLQIGATG